MPFAIFIMTISEVCEIGEGWGFYDGNGNESWDLGDTLVIYPGELIQGIDITLEEFQPGTSMLLDK